MEAGRSRRQGLTYFYPKISVAVVELKEPLAVGDKVAIVGRTTRIEQVVDSIEIEHGSIKSVNPGQSVGSWMELGSLTSFTRNLS